MQGIKDSLADIRQRALTNIEENIFSQSLDIQIKVLALRVTLNDNALEPQWNRCFSYSAQVIIKQCVDI